MLEPVQTPDKRPGGVPAGARLVTLAELRDRVAKPNGSLRLGPRGSYLRIKMFIWPFGIYGTVFDVLGGALTAEGHRVFSLGYAHGVRRPSQARRRIIFNQPEDADRQLWIWTLDDAQREREARAAARRAGVA